MAISDQVKRLLLARSAGFCMNPGCRADLFQFFNSGAISSVEELAHIIAASEKGPRGTAAVEPSARDQYENIILLCPWCHTLIDKNPTEFPVAMLRDWKSRHESEIINIFAVPALEDRATLKQEVKNLLRRNRTLFNLYGPFSSPDYSPLDDRAVTWGRLVRSDIIPNNRYLTQLLSKNRHLLFEKELETLEAFRAHADALAYNHLSGDKTSDAPLFPKAMNEILDA